MKFSGFERRLDNLEGAAYAGWIPSIDANGNRAWIEGRGCGIKFLREITKWQRDGGEPSEDLQEQVQLWARAEVEGDSFGDMARANRIEARKILGL